MFYVSTWGGTASGWFARALSLHPEVVCFQGTRAIPPYPSGVVPDMEPDAFAEALHQLWGTSRHTKMFGSTNGFHGLLMKDPIERRNGTFASTIRHPLLRIHGLYCHYALTVEESKLEGSDVYTPFKNEKSDYAELNLVDQTIQLKPFAREFLMMASPTVKYDMISIRSLPDEYIFRFEGLTKNREYFAQCFDLLVGRFSAYARSLYDNPQTRASVGYFDLNPKITEQYLDTVFNQPRYGSKSGGMNIRTPDEVFEAWPDLYKYLFALCLKENGGIAAVQDYKKAGYILPEVYSRIPYDRLSPLIWQAISGEIGQDNSSFFEEALIRERVNVEVSRQLSELVRQQTSKLNEQLEQTMKRVMVAEAEAEAAKSEAITARTAAEAAKSEAITARTAAEAAKSETMTARAEAEAAKSETMAARAAAEAAKSETMTAKAEAEAAKSEARTAEAEAEAARGEVDAVRNSTSWRVTEPLRAIKNMVSGG